MRKKTETSTETKVEEISVPEKAPKKQVTYESIFKGFISKKLFMTIFATCLLWLAYWREVNYLYSFAVYPDAIAAQLITAFVGLTRDFMVVLTSIIGFYLSISGLVSWKHGTDSAVNQVASFIQEKRDEKRDENINIKEERIEHVYVEGQEGAPSKRPFSKIQDTDQE